MIPSTHLDFVAHFARTTPDALAVVDLGQARQFTYCQLDEHIERARVVLADVIGEPVGQRVLVVARNRAEMLILHFACIRCGAIFVPVNWRLAAAEVATIVADCRPALIVVEPEFAEVVGYGCPRIALDGSAAGLEALMLAAGTDGAPAPDTAQALPADSARPASAAPAARATPRRLAARHVPTPNTPITLLYSSGTTGKPKGVIITLLNAFASSLNLALDMRCNSDSVFLCDMPLFHTAGLFAAARTPLSVGGTVLLSQKFDAPLTYARLSDEQLGVTHYFCVTQMAMMMRQLPEFEGRRLARLTALITGGAPNPEAHIRRWLDDGVPMINAWGMSEIGSGTAQPLRRPQRLLANPSAIGVPHMTLDMKLVTADGQEAPSGVPGEIWVRGWSVTPGYWERPDLNAQAFVDGWFRTGDIGIRDDCGAYRLVDRIKDMYISGGENVYPAEIEAVIVELAGVSDVAVFGVPHETWGETGAALVVTQPGSQLDTTLIEAHCKARLARFKVPRFIAIVASLPRTASGKIQKHLLRAAHRP
ncbi:MAG: AMP-binding protein [Proteobacteria bacterium]|nr:AMP-binding protein [Pseudomonadota bacterium]